MIIGVLHLKPLPGSPRYTSFEEVEAHSLRNARRLEEGGVDAVLVENYGDLPYLEKVGAETVACMTALLKDMRNEVSVPVGVNVLRNDSISASAIARAVKAEFIRVNQTIFPSASPEGFLFPQSAVLARYMRQIDLKVKIFADVMVKHAVHLAGIEDYLENIERAFADFIVVTGTSTGKPPGIEDVKIVKERSHLPVFVGSGVNPENIEKFMEYADGFIVGTYFKDGEEVSVEKVRKLCSLISESELNPSFFEL